MNLLAMRLMRSTSKILTELAIPKPIASMISQKRKIVTYRSKGNTKTKMIKYIKNLPNVWSAKALE